ncbi:MAG: chromate efflux transporter [Methylobacterium sp.]|uniref:chromate efflux transporter n=1 Tax=Methylobacterium sp. TaxID=409 RepID=UPI0025D21EE7|nr:chromate efflux transporter [Methylobacterium sp.]MBX9933779.1 chromate efflux transporter [Methylobacterium sp.]
MAPAPSDLPQTEAPAGSVGEVFSAFLKLGLTAFGGPVAHIGYFRTEFVARRRWLDEAAYADLVALCQFLPGPASSQVGLGLGLMRAGPLGALAAFTAFTLPSVLILMAFAYGLTMAGGLGGGWLHGLKAVTVAVVAQAVFGMARNLAPDGARATLLVAAALVALAFPGSIGQVSTILLGAVIGLFLPGDTAPAQTGGRRTRLSRRLGAAALALYGVLLVALPLLATAFPTQSLQLADAFYRAGALVFGGGHVVLPLLQAAIVPKGWMSADTFLAGYGAAQAVPGPLFTFAAYLGAAMGPEPNGWRGALLCLGFIFLPAILLVFGALPFWEVLRRGVRARRMLSGVNAAVVGLLLAALYDPVWTSGIRGPADAGLAASAYLALAVWQLPPWSVVIGGALVGAMLG